MTDSLDSHVDEPVVDRPEKVPDGTAIPEGAPVETDHMEYVFRDREGRILSAVKPGPDGRALPCDAPDGACTYEPLWLDSEGEIVGERPPTLVKRKEIGVPGKKHRGRTVGGPQRVGRDRSYRKILAPGQAQGKQSFKRTDLMINFSGNVTAGEIFYQFLSPAHGKLDKFAILAPEGAMISIRSAQKNSGPSITQEFGPILDTTYTSTDELQVDEGGIVEMSSSLPGSVVISCILHSVST